MASTIGGIRFINYTNHPLTGVLECWTGFKRGSSLDGTGTIFDPAGVFLPEPSPTPLAITPSGFDQQTGTGAFVALIDFSRVLTDLRAFASRGSIATEAFVSTVCEAARPQIVSRSVRFLGSQENSPGLFSTTINRDANVFIGLHVDSWYQSPISQRSQAANRLCINLGEETRTFLFLPVGVAGMSADCPDGPIHPTELARCYLSRRPESRIYALRVPPGCAYIAPTENIAHDASTSTMCVRDWSSTLLGQFTPMENPRQVSHLNP